MEFGLIAATAADWPIVGQIAWVFGKLMDAIYNFLNLFGIQNIGICIILFTIIIYTLMIPLTIKQQKFSKMQSVMMPEIQKLQKKYAGKRDQASMLKMQEEQQLIYEKYGSSPTGGCLPMVIQLPILFALYPVIQEVPRYVNGIKEIYMPVVNQIMATDGYQKILEKIGNAAPVYMPAKKKQPRISCPYGTAYRCGTQRSWLEKFHLQSRQHSQPRISRHWKIWIIS